MFRLISFVNLIVLSIMLACSSGDFSQGLERAKKLDSDILALRDYYCGMSKTDPGAAYLREFLIEVIRRNEPEYPEDGICLELPEPNSTTEATP